MGGSEPPHSLSARQLLQQLPHCFSELRMARFGSDLGQRFENKAPLMHSRMRDFQSRLIYHAIPEKQYIDINVARTFGAHAETSHCGFRLQRQVEQLSGCHFSFDGGDAVEKPRLIGDVDWLGFIQG